MKKIDEPSKQKIMDACEVGGDWFGRLDPHEAGRIAGIVNAAIKGLNEMVEQGKTPAEVVEYLAHQMDEEITKKGRMHELICKGLEQLAEEADISVLFKTGYKPPPAVKGSGKPGWRSLLTNGLERHNAGIPPVGGD